MIFVISNVNPSQNPTTKLFNRDLVTVFFIYILLKNFPNMFWGLTIEVNFELKVKNWKQVGKIKFRIVL
ncbi:MAG: hypothetical protein C0599_01500 [Salinivirgaceae bacterium]|nr:MAG: hypothetical protein C0599_01500 [Salinivirgaceae bacterium]